MKFDNNYVLHIWYISYTNGFSDCGPCYGAETKNVPCCDSCNEVIQAHEAKGWTYNVTEFEQCNEFSDMGKYLNPYDIQISG